MFIVMRCVFLFPHFMLYQIEDADARSRTVCFLDSHQETHITVNHDCPRLPTSSVSEESFFCVILCTHGFPKDPVILHAFSDLREERDAICVVSTDGRVEYINEIFSHIFGYKRSEFIGQNIAILLAPEANGLERSFIREMSVSESFLGKVNSKAIPCFALY